MPSTTPRKFYRQVSIEDRLPSKGGKYWVKFKNGLHEETSFYEKAKHFYHGSDSLNHLIDYWEEEVELPTKEQIDKEFEHTYFDSYPAHWLLELILNKK